MFLIVIPSLTLLLLQFNTKFKTNKLRNYSTGIFFMHSFICYLLNMILKFININISSKLFFVIVLFIVLITLTILYKVNNKYINKVIK